MVKDPSKLIKEGHVRSSPLLESRSKIGHERVEACPVGKLDKGENNPSGRSDRRHRSEAWSRAWRRGAQNIGGEEQGHNGRQW